MLWHFYIAQYKDQKSWEKHVRKHIKRFKRLSGAALPVNDEIAYRDVNLTLLFGGEPVLVIFEPSDYKKKFVFYNRQTNWMLILLAESSENTILTSFYLTEADSPESYFKMKGYTEVPPQTEIKEVSDGKQGYYRRLTEEEEEFLRQLRSQCRHVEC